MHEAGLRLTPVATRRLLILGILILWEAAPRLGLVHSLFLPPLSEAVMAAYRSYPMYLQNLLVTMGEVAAALVVACGGGILLGALIGSVPPLRRSLSPLLSSLYAIPLVVLYPLMAVWLGIGSESKIAFASVYGMIPAALASAAGIQGIDPQLSLTAKSMGATLVQRIVHVIIPAAIPSILSGLRIGGALAIVGVVLAQMLLSTAGLGFLITTYRTLLDGPHVFAAILFILMIALAFDWAIQLLERRVAPWTSVIAPS
jgi:NitT/TauT family transport system permease protein/taurine transport system permease protein